MNRVFSAQHDRFTFAHVAAIAQALGIELTPVVKDGKRRTEEEAGNGKARRLVRLLQGTSGLEGQALDQQDSGVYGRADHRETAAIQ